EGQRTRRRIGHAERPPLPSGRADELPSERLVRRPPRRRHLRAERHDREACVRRGGRGWKRLAETHRHRVRNADRPLPDKPADLEAEDTAPDPIEIARHDGHVETGHDSFEAAFEWQQIARPAHRAFRKDADDVTLLELVPGAFEGLDDLAPPASN